MKKNIKKSIQKLRNIIQMISYQLMNQVSQLAYILTKTGKKLTTIEFIKQFIEGKK